MMDGKERRTENINVYIDTQNASVFTVIYWKVNLPLKFSELMIFDGEDEGKINRPVGLFTEKTIKNDEPPELYNIFRSGQRLKKTIDVCNQNIMSIGYNSPKMKESITIS